MLSDVWWGRVDGWTRRSPRAGTLAVRPSGRLLTGSRGYNNILFRVTSTPGVQAAAITTTAVQWGANRWCFFSFLLFFPLRANAHRGVPNPAENCFGIAEVLILAPVRKITGCLGSGLPGNSRREGADVVADEVFLNKSSSGPNIRKQVFFLSLKPILKAVVLRERVFPLYFKVFPHRMTTLLRFG